MDAKQGKGKGGAKPQAQKGGEQPAPSADQNKNKQQKKPQEKKAESDKKVENTSTPQTATNNKQEKPQPKKEETQAPAPATAPAPAQTAQPTQNPQPQANAQKDKPSAPKKELPKGKGLVKAVPSGDTIIVIHLEKGKPPAERKITLSNIKAPKLGLRTAQEKKEDEPFAFQSREYLRKIAIGKSVSYVIEGSGKSGNRDYGLVHLIREDGDQDLATLVVSEGWATVSRKEDSKGPLRTDVEALLKLEEEAKRENRGIFSKKNNNSKRPITDAASNPPALYDKLRGHPQHGVVENVLNGSTLIITLLPAFYDIKLLLSGVECPSNGKPYDKEAKFCTEHFLLHRDVQVVFEGVDKFNFYGTVSLNGNNISEELLRRGLGQYVDWSGQKTAFKDKLRAAEKSAQDKKVGIWSLPQEQKAAPAKTDDKKGSLKPGKEIYGKVIEVNNAGTITVTDINGNDWTINLSSIKVPRGGKLTPKPEIEQAKEGEQKDAQAPKDKPKDQKDALERTYAWEGKEYLRKRIIGQKVRCVLDYVRTADQQKQAQQKSGKPDAQLQDKPYWSVYFEKNNVAVELVANGLAKPQEHRGGDLRSKDYEDILKAEIVAQKSGRGQYASKDKAAVLYINDITSDPNKSKKFLASLKRGKNRGVVEYVAHASRFKIYVPKESCELFINLSAIKTPRTPKEAFFNESVAFAKERVHQRDVEFEVLSTDKGGNFIGNVWVNRENFSTLLLQEGFAQLIFGIARDSDHFGEFRAAEETAKKAKKHLWHDYDEEAERQAREKRRQEYEAAHTGTSTGSKQEFIDVVVTEIVDATKFYVQLVGADTTAKLEELMQQISLQDPGTEAYKPKFGEYVLAQFTADDAWYRAKVVGETPEGEVKVFYVDYGNSETVPTSRVRRLGENFDIKKLAAQAHEASLAYVKPPPLNVDYGQEAAEFLKELVDGKTMMANVEYRDNNGLLYLSLGDRESQVHVNAALVRAGLARVEKVRGGKLQNLIAKLREEETKARQAHTYIWEYGDPGSDDDDEPLRPQKKASAPAKKAASAPAPAKGKEEKDE